MNSMGFGMRHVSQSQAHRDSFTSIHPIFNDRPSLLHAPHTGVDVRRDPDVAQLGDVLRHGVRDRVVLR